MWPQTEQRGNQDSRGPSPWRQPVRASPMPLWQTGCRSRHSWAILQTRHSQSNSPSPAQHRPPRLGESKHPSVLEPSGLSRGDGKQPYGMTLIPWQGGKNVTGDVTVNDTVADSYLHLLATCADSVAEGKVSRKETEYAILDNSYTFIPLAFETYGPINDKGTTFLQELCRRLRTLSDDPRESAFLLQRISITLQRFNAIAFSDTFTPGSETEFEA